MAYESESVTSRDVPWPRSYWVEPGRLLASCYPGDADSQVARGRLSALLDCGIRGILNLQEPGEVGHDGRPFAPYAADFRDLAAGRGLVARCFRYPVRDVTAPSRAAMAEILDLVDLCLGAGVPLLLHCWGGRGRTGTVVGCWLARHGVATGESALAMVQDLRRHDPTAHRPSPETHEQRNLVRHWPVGG